jgi:hypothetical protein
MCFICGRGNCTPSFHSLEEQKAFEPAEEAYDKYLEVREQCVDDWRNADEDKTHYTEGGG